jgi:hypothetical protein
MLLGVFTTCSIEPSGPDFELLVVNRLPRMIVAFASEPSPILADIGRSLRFEFQSSHLLLASISSHP